MRGTEENHSTDGVTGIQGTPVGRCRDRPRVHKARVGRNESLEGGSGYSGSLRCRRLLGGDGHGSRGVEESVDGLRKKLRLSWIEET